MKRVVCQQLKDYYVQHHFSRYIETLRDKKYMLARNMSKTDVEKEIRHLWDKRLELQKYDEIKDKKRIRKVLQFCVFDLD